MTGASSMHEAPKAGALDNLEGLGGEGGSEWGDTCPCGRFMLMYGKSHHNNVIILQLK